MRLLVAVCLAIILPLVVAEDVDVCTLPKEVGPCLAYVEAWYWNTQTQRCEFFIYGGCQGNGNMFPTEMACKSKCGGPVCALPKDPGPCKAINDMWYWDTKTQRCEAFNYGGCGGNRNRFMTEKECQSRCGQVCTLPSETGPCRAYMPMWFWNTQTQRCEMFVYGGCPGNANRFLTEMECQFKCGAVCTLPKDSGPCNHHFHMWHWDNQTGSCERFHYGGCEGNGNRFNSKWECKSKCGRDCSYNRDEFLIGDNFPAMDGCNDCRCTAAGVECTTKVCSLTCKVTTSGEDKVYQDGEKFPAPDGCNTCVCRGGLSLCTISDCREEKSCIDPYTGIIRPSGSEWKCSDGCNKCLCINGLIKIITKMACGVKHCEDPITGEPRPSHRFFGAADGCNTCRCYYGHSACTAMDCSLEKSCTFDGEIHASGSFWDSKDGCKTCVCSNGNTTCGLSVFHRESPICLPDGFRPLKKPCRDPITGQIYDHGASWRADGECNTCLCQDGEALCTKSDCDEKPCVDQFTGIIHPSGSTWICNDGCNKCWCTSGNVGQTLMACLSPPKSCVDPFTGEKHPSGEQFPSGDGCNTCWCSNGQSACTGMDCRQEKSCTVNGEVYASGASWKIGRLCPTCVCSNGKSNCTGIICPLESPNKDPTSDRVSPVDASFVAIPCDEGLSYNLIFEFGCRCERGFLNCPHIKTLANKEPVSDTANPRGYSDKFTDSIIGCEKPCKDQSTGRVHRHGTSYIHGCSKCLCDNGESLCNDKDCAPCPYNGQTYPHGSNFVSDDGCNTCSCINGGGLCTLMGCDQMPCKDPKSGEEHASGSIWEAGDGCNTCQCVNGNTVCTENKCPCKDTTSGEEHPHDSTWIAADGCNPCFCKDGKTLCTDFECGTKPCNDPDTGISHPSGSGWLCSDGCNECWCHNGNIGSTSMPCLKPCEDQFTGKLHPHGSTYIHGCSKCVCDNGESLCNDTDCAPCHYNGQTYPHGSFFMSSDRCNSCFCNNGAVLCTLMDCERMPCKDPDSGVEHASGSIWDVGDGCNTCQCLNGKTVCTENKCQ